MYSFALYTSVWFCESGSACISRIWHKISTRCIFIGWITRRKDNLIAIPFNFKLGFHFLCKHSCKIPVWPQGLYIPSNCVHIKSLEAVWEFTETWRGIFWCNFSSLNYEMARKTNPFILFLSSYSWKHPNKLKQLQGHSGHRDPHREWTDSGLIWGFRFFKSDQGYTGLLRTGLPKCLCLWLLTCASN